MTRCQTPCPPRNFLIMKLPSKVPKRHLGHWAGVFGCVQGIIWIVVHWSMIYLRKRSSSSWYKSGWPANFYRKMISDGSHTADLFYRFNWIYVVISAVWILASVNILFSSYVAKSLNCGKYGREITKKIFIRASFLFWSLTAIAVCVLDVVAVGTFANEIVNPKRKSFFDILKTPPGLKFKEEAYDHDGNFIDERNGPKEHPSGTSDVPILSTIDEIRPFWMDDIQPSNNLAVLPKSTDDGNNLSRSDSKLRQSLPSRDLQETPNNLYAPMNRFRASIDKINGVSANGSRYPYNLDGMYHKSYDFETISRKHSPIVTDTISEYRSKVRDRYNSYNKFARKIKQGTEEQNDAVQKNVSLNDSNPNVLSVPLNVTNKNGLSDTKTGESTTTSNGFSNSSLNLKGSKRVKRWSNSRPTWRVYDWFTGDADKDVTVEVILPWIGWFLRCAIVWCANAFLAIALLGASCKGYRQLRCDSNYVVDDYRTVVEYPTRPRPIYPSSRCREQGTGIYCPRIC